MKIPKEKTIHKQVRKEFELSRGQYYYLLKEGIDYKRIKENYVKKLYNAHPFIYSKKNIYDFKPLKISEDWFKGKRILDAGCGTGNKSFYFNKLGAIVIGIDLSETHINLCKEKSKELKNIKFIEGDILNHKFKDKFDMIFCDGVLHHISNPIKAVNNLSKYLKPNGFFLIMVYHKLGKLFRETLKTKVIHLLSKDLDKRLYLAKKLFPIIKYRDYDIKQETLLASECINYYSTHYIGEVLKWFKYNNIKYYSGLPSLVYSDFVEYINNKNSYGLTKLFFKTFPIHKLKYFQRPNLIWRCLLQLIMFLTQASAFCLVGKKIIL